MNQASNVVIAFLVACLLLNGSVIAQTNTNFHFGFIGTTGDTSIQTGETVMIQYNKCFEISNGLLKFNTTQKGAFAISCIEIPPKDELQVLGYPNPVVNTLTIRSLKVFPMQGFVKYSFVLVDMMGRPIKEIKTDLASINNGFIIPVYDLPMGYFTVTLYADKEVIQSFKILKGV